MENSVVKLTKAQKDWVYEQCGNRNIIFMSIHGSHLYGLNREGSDIDIKAIYCPSKEDLLMGRALKTYNKSNDELAVEIELKSLSSFLNSAMKADTNCMDLLHTPDEFILRKSYVWDDLVKYRSDIYSKNMKGLIGYIKTHANKYSNKIQRYEEMEKLLNLAKQVKCDGFLNIRDVTESTALEKLELKHVNKVSLVSDHEQQYLEVCGKKYIYSWGIDQLISAMEFELKRYGKRTQSGVSVGLDTKALSHAVRVLCQLEEVITEGTITFPLKDSAHIMFIKNGAMPLARVMDEIDSRYDRCVELLANSNLQEESDISRILHVVKKYTFNRSTYGN
jgi:predicted nucleotidyltransferase